MTAQTVPAYTLTPEDVKTLAAAAVALKTVTSWYKDETGKSYPFGQTMYSAVLDILEKCPAPAPIQYAATVCHRCHWRQTDPEGIGYAVQLCEKCATDRLNPYA
jgi:hypothetical protein